MKTMKSINRFSVKNNITKVKKESYLNRSQQKKRMATQEIILLYALLGLLLGIIYGLRRIYFLEQRLADLDEKIGKWVGRKNR